MFRRKLVIKTSLTFTSSRNTSSPPGVRTSMVMRFLARWNSGCPAPRDHAGMKAISSSTLLVSTLMTSAPSDASSRPVNGSAT